MTAIQKAIAVAGVAKQTVAGTAETNPTFIHGVTGGAPIDVTLAQDLAPLTSAQRVAVGVDRTEQDGTLNLQTRAFDRAVGLWLLGAFGSVNTTGIGPYVHVFTPAANAQILTVFDLLGSTWKSLKDVVVDELEISWDGSGPVDLTVTGMGTTVAFISAPTPTTDETKSPYLQGGGGTFKLDVSSATPATARVKAGSIKIMNNAEAIRPSGSIVPTEIYPGQQTYEYTLTLVPTDFSDWKKQWSGSGSGTAVSEGPVYGSAEITFASGTDTLKFESLKTAFTSTYPESDPSGGPVEIELVGHAVLPSSGSAMTATLTNTTTAY